MVKRNSLLGRALAARWRFGEQLPPYGILLSKLAGSDQAGPEFDRIVGRAKAESEDELAAKLLDLVVTTALEAGMAAPRIDGSGKRIGGSVVVERRAEIEAAYEELFAALDILTGAFGCPAVHVAPKPEDGPGPRTASPAESGSKPVPVWDDSSELRMHVNAWQVALGKAEAVSDDPRAVALRDHVRFQSEEAPAALLAMREHLLTRKAAALASLANFPSGRNQGRGADRRAFTIMLIDGMRSLVGSPQLEFCTTMTQALFGGVDNVNTLEGTRALRSREAKRDAPGRN